jgi:hypothetical protein
MVAARKPEQPYRFDRGFEAALVTRACSSSRFYGRIGYAVKPKLLEAPAAALALEACQAIASDAGKGPGSTLIVMQRLYRWMDEGRVTIEQIEGVTDMLDEAEEAGLPDDELMISELRPILQYRLRDQALLAGMAAFGKRRDLSSVVELEQRAARLGESDTSLGVVVGDDAFADVCSLSQLERLPTGVPELDHGLNGGLQRAGLGIVIAETGGGKSMFLSHQAAYSTLSGLFVCVATLELPRPIVLARVIAAITGLPIDAILDGQRGMSDARVRLAAMSGLGRCIVQDFPPQGTTMSELAEWITSCEQHTGEEVGLLIIDYMDKMASAGVAKDAGSYELGKYVANDLRGYADARRKFLWSACQATRNKKGKRLDYNDIADSMNKPRIADLVLTMNPEEEGEMMRWFVAKHRTGRSRFEIGPLPTDFAIGRAAPFNLGKDGMPV